MVKAKLKQEGEETDRLLMERNTLRDENLGMRTRQSQAADRRLAEREAKIGELSVKLSNATEESKGLRSRLEMSERQGSDEFESKNSRLEKRIAIVEADRDELKRCLDGAMAELEIADAESKDAYDSKLHFSELEKKAADLDVLLSERNDEIARLRTQTASFFYAVFSYDVRYGDALAAHVLWGHKTEFFDLLISHIQAQKKI